MIAFGHMVVFGQSLFLAHHMIEYCPEKKGYHPFHIFTRTFQLKIIFFLHHMSVVGITSLFHSNLVSWVTECTLCSLQDVALRSEVSRRSSSVVFCFHGGAFTLSAAD